MQGYKVIDGSQIVISEHPGFHRDYTEKEFLKYVEASQDYVENADFEDHKTKIMGKSAYAIWVDRCRCIEVEELENGMYHVTNNGHHRAFIARKYGLKIVAYVDDYI